MLALAAHADSEGIAYPAVSRIAKLANISERYVKSILNRLPSDEIRMERGGGRGRSNRYRLFIKKVNWSSPFIDSETVKSDDINGDIFGNETVTSLGGNGEQLFTRINKKNQNEDSCRLVGQPTHSQETNPFEESEEEWATKLKQRYPEHDVEYEMRNFHNHCERKGKRANRRGFEAWMKIASPSIKRPPEKASNNSKYRDAF
jgi:hypothetical protein